ncbi:MAG: hypothetical protein SGILL_005494 [Bacillariaceae sp.]
MVVPLIVALYILSLNFRFFQHQDEATHQASPEQSEKQEQALRSPPAVSAHEPVATIAHVVSLIKCTKQASVTGFLDAAAVLRHSIHLQSIHTPSSGSKYSYKMYAIVHETCREHAKLLERLGYTSIVKPSPVTVDDITPGWYREHVEGENCCGSAEFIKLYAYTLMDHPISVHWDMDVALFHPMDDLFDSMIFTKDSNEGKAARQRLVDGKQLQHSAVALPDTIEAFFTRDITSSQPWEIRQGVQGGFLVARPNQEYFDAYMKFIKEANYVKGRGNTNGWAGLGYGGFQGAMAYQGAVAFFYDQVMKTLPSGSGNKQAVELNACTWNQVVADVIWRGPKRMEHFGQCRQYPQPGVDFKDNTPENGQCTDCRILAVDQVKSAHYTACKKPWECMLPKPRVPKNPDEKLRLKELTNITTCGLLFERWFDLRRDFEEKLNLIGGVNPSPRNGKYETQYFGGYCQLKGKYFSMQPPPEDFDIKRLYGV